MEPPNPLRITISNRTGCKAPAALIRKAVRSVNQKYPIGEGSIAILLTTDEDQRALNKAFRDLDSTTDVLTFPSEVRLEGMKNIHLGDISISVPQAMRQANARGAKLEHELVFLAIHGALHLSGLTDESESDQQTMRKAMNEVALAVEIPEDHEWMSLPAPNEGIA